MSNNSKPLRTFTVIGYWQSDREPGLPHPKNFIKDQISAEDRKLLVEYLDRGKVLMQCLGYSFCRFNCGTPDYEMGTANLTDGKYVWPEKLSHYISKHDVWLPEPFIHHTRDNQNYNPGEIEFKKEDFDVKNLLNYEWWKSFQSLKAT